MSQRIYVFKVKLGGKFLSNTHRNYEKEQDNWTTLLESISKKRRTMHKAITQ